MTPNSTGTAPPAGCPACGAALVVTRLQCPSCATEVAGAFRPDGGRLVSLPEPHASLLELFLRMRGNVKDVERALGLSYPTVRARLEEAFAAARPKLEPQPAAPQRPAPGQAAALRAPILDALERGEISAAEAAARIRALTTNRPQESHT